MNNKLIYVCSPYKGDVELNTANAQKYCADIIKEGNIPIAPHIYFTQFLNDDNPEERRLGIQAGVVLLEKCEELRVYGSIITEGMAHEIEAAKSLGIRICHGGELCP